MGAYFREFLARRVEHGWPHLAEKVRSWSESELLELYEQVRCHQEYVS